MGKIHFGLFILLAFSLASNANGANDCATKSIDITNLEEGQYLAVEVQGITYGVLKRRLSQSKALHKSSDLVDGALGDSNRPPDWWPNETMPPSSSPWASSPLRSPHSALFVFYTLAPIRTDEGACNVIHYPRRKRPSFPEPNFYDALGPDWSGGFVDHCYGVGYDYSGRPVYSASYDGYPELERLSKFNLIVPEYKVADAEDILWLCK